MRKPILSPKQKDEIANLFLDRDYSFRALGNKYKVSERTIRRALEERGVYSQNTTVSRQAAAIAEVAEEFNASAKQVRQALRSWVAQRRGGKANA